MSKSVALHICCSICLVAPREDLHSKGYQISGIFFNPNIQPYDEYLSRHKALNYFIKNNPITSISSSEYDSNLHGCISKAVGFDRKKMCIKCYEMRLYHTAVTAEKNKIKHFSTTLLSSPFQDKDKIREIGAKLEKEFKLTFVDSKEWEQKHYESKKRIKDAGLYVQKYCGCIYSKMDAKARKSAKQSGVNLVP
ncbi:MAG: hypothetical protein A2231_12155 [Candidatus Firestonebacteria bacterium RIFOXYA2_FULL_40_8]|nr:MAG: hypothetical protein A2231_12155 [Candidatus Firestonebacteria bacterium RIFOXYA2_FULL_40_8]